MAPRCPDSAQIVIVAPKLVASRSYIPIQGQESTVSIVSVQLGLEQLQSSRTMYCFAVCSVMLICPWPASTQFGVGQVLLRHSSVAPPHNRCPLQSTERAMASYKLKVLPRHLVCLSSQSALNWSRTSASQAQQWPPNNRCPL